MIKNSQLLMSQSQLKNKASKRDLVKKRHKLVKKGQNRVSRIYSMQKMLNHYRNRSSTVSQLKRLNNLSRLFKNLNRRKKKLLSTKRKKKLKLRKRLKM